MVANRKSMIQFDPAQQAFFADTARVQVVNWHRQKGKDFTTAAKAVDSALSSGQDWYIISLTQRQADATFDKCKQMAKGFKKLLKLQGEIRYSETEFEEYDKWIDETFKCKAREIIFPNGARVVSLPGRDPDTLAGLTGNVIFTEFGLFPNGGYAHWRVVFPLATRGFRVIVISTPRGRNTKFFELCHSPEIYSYHFCDIHRSIAEGFQLTDQNGEPCTVEEFKKLYGDEIGFQREYECKFTGDLEALVKWAQLQAAGEIGRNFDFRFLKVEKDSGWIENFFSMEAPNGSRLELGWDVARTGHFSSLWCNLAVPGAPQQLQSLVLMHDTSFALQRNVVRAAMDARLTRTAVGCGDSTGLGMDSNETLEGLYGDRWEGVNFGGNRKAELGSSLFTAFDERGQGIPPLDSQYKFIATDIYAVQKDSNSTQKLKLVESDNPLLPGSHCDIAYSAALARRAAVLESVDIGVVRL